jgi:hypothetical protein
VTGTSDAAAIDAAVTNIASVFTIRDLGQVNWCLNMAITADAAAGTVTLSQHQLEYISTLLHRHGVQDCNPAPTPCLTRAAEDPASIAALGASDITTYQSLVGECSG